MNDIIQGSPEWFAARLGKVTGSKIADVMMKPNLAGYRNYMAQLTAERMTGVVEETYQSFDMARGTELEPLARALYCFQNDVEVTEVGFVNHPYVDNMGCSPDGLVVDDYNDGLIEIKCPKTAQHQDLLLGGKIDGKYVKQMQQQMACTGRQWCDYCSYDPLMPNELKLFVHRIFRDEIAIKEMELATVTFLKDVDSRVAELESLCKR
jgi:putative phage-type endonuclease